MDQEGRPIVGAETATIETAHAVDDDLEPADEGSPARPDRLSVEVLVDACAGYPEGEHTGRVDIGEARHERRWAGNTTGRIVGDGIGAERRAPLKRTRRDGDGSKQGAPAGGVYRARLLVAASIDDDESTSAGPLRIMARNARQVAGPVLAHDEGCGWRSRKFISIVVVEGTVTL